MGFVFPSVGPFSKMTIKFVTRSDFYRARERAIQILREKQPCHWLHNLLRKQENANASERNTFRSTVRVMKRNDLPREIISDDFLSLP